MYSVTLSLPCFLWVNNWALVLGGKKKKKKPDWEDLWEGLPGWAGGGRMSVLWGPNRHVPDPARPILDGASH